MVGSRFCELSEKNLDLVKADLKGDIIVDITNKKSVTEFFKNYEFEYLILFSAFTDVDEAEKQRDDKKGLCWKINVNGTTYVVKACRKFKRKLIFLSTDFVFDGVNGPYSEEDPPGGKKDQISWYGLTKLEAEKIVKSQLPDSIILRITYPYRGRFSQKDDLPKRILKLYKEGKLYPLFDDQFTTPTFIDDVAPAIKLLIANNTKGTFHLASTKVVSQYGFGKEIVKVFGGQSEQVKQGSLKVFLTRSDATPRPVKGGLKVDKIKLLGFTPTDWQRGIGKIYEQSEGKLI